MTDLPPGWTRTTIGEVCGVVSGATPKSTVPEYWGGDIPWLTPDDLSRNRSKTVYEGRRSLTAAGYDSCSTRMVPPGSLLFSSRAPIGYVAIAGGWLCTNQGFKTAVPSAEIDSSYLYWFLRFKTSEIEARASGTTFKEISAKGFAKTELFFPSLVEQRRIVTALEAHISRVEQGSNQLHQASMRVRSLRKSVLHHYCSFDTSNEKWSEVAIGDIGDVVTGSTPNSKDPNYWGGDFPFVTPGDIGYGDKVISASRTLTDAGADVSRCLDSGAILVVCIGATLGKVGWIDRPCVTNQQINAIRVDPDLYDSRFIAYALSAPRLNSRLRSEASNTTLPILNKKRFQRIKIHVPVLKEQRRRVIEIEEKIASLEALQGVVHASHARALRLQVSLYKEAFTGKLGLGKSENESVSTEWAEGAA